MDKRERAERAKQEDAILNRVLIWIAGSVVLEALLLLLDRYYVNTRVSELAIKQGLYQMFGVLAIVLPIAFLACAAWWVLTWRKGERRLLPQILTIVLLILSVCAVVARLYPNKTGISALYVGVPCLAVLALVYYLYQHEFFLVTLLGAMSGLGLWLLDRRGGHEIVVYAYLVLEVLILAAVVVVGGVAAGVASRFGGQSGGEGGNAAQMGTSAGDGEAAAFAPHAQVNVFDNRITLADTKGNLYMWGSWDESQNLLGAGSAEPQKIMEGIRWRVTTDGGVVLRYDTSAMTVAEAEAFLTGNVGA